MTSLLFVSTACALELLAVAWAGSQPQMTGPARSATLFLAAVPPAVATIFIHGLRPRDPLLVWVGVALLAPLGIVGAQYFVSFPAGTAAALWSAWGHSLVVQGLMSLMTSAGVLMQRKPDDVAVSEAGRGREEVENLFLLREAQRPETPLTLYRFGLLLEAGPCFVAMNGNRILGFLMTMRIGEAAVLHSLLVAREDELALKIRRTLIRGALGRPEIFGARRLVALVRNHDEPEARAWLSCGLKPLSDTGPDIDQARVVREHLDGLFRADLPDWVPLEDCQALLAAELPLGPHPARSEVAEVS